MIPAKLLELLKKYWPHVVILVIGIGVGWGVKPSVVKIEEREKIVEKQVTTEAQKELLTAFENLRIEMEKVRETQVTEKYHREELETRLADGTYTKKVTVDKNIDSHTKETETKVEVRVVEVVKEIETIKTVTVDKIVEKEKIVTPMLAQWHVAILVGAQPNINPLTHGGLQLGASIERRIVGPLFLGLQVGGSPTNFNGVQVMGKVGFEF